MKLPLSYKFYIRDLHKFETDVIAMLEKFGYRVEKLELDKMTLTKGSFIQNLFSNSTLTRKSKIEIDYSDNMVKLSLELKNNRNVLTKFEQRVWDDFIYRVINQMQSERRDFPAEFALPKKSKFSIA